MKTLRYIFLFLAIVALDSCRDITVGYLWTEDASYKPDKMIVKAELDPVEDANRIKWGAPWVSTPIEGVQGTQQIFVKVKEVKSTDGNPAKMREHLKVYGDGTFEVPCIHDIPRGNYLISLNFSNEGYSKDVDDCFTIVVE